METYDSEFHVFGKTFSRSYIFRKMYVGHRAYPVTDEWTHTTPGIQK